MSLITWKAEFYPKPATIVERSEALEHSLQKWTGLRSANRDKHGVWRRVASVITDGAETMSMAAVSCALCVHADLNGTGKCGQCPLYLSRGEVPCDDRVPGETVAPWAAWSRDGDPEPMITALQEAIDYDQEYL